MLVARSLLLALLLLAGIGVLSSLLANIPVVAASLIMTKGYLVAAEGERLTFARFLRYGLPITLAQLTVGALYVVALFWLMR
jgi:Na+/H+ antiporter NhaD/arsenite permease-like protein